MVAYQTSIIIEEKSGLPVYRQIANGMISLIQQGKLKPGSFVPGTRQLAVALNVHRNTVINAYNELLAQNWIEALPRKGYRVLPDLVVRKPRSFKPGANYAGHNFDTIASENVLCHLFNEAGVNDIVVNDGLPDINLMPFDEMMKGYRKIIKSLHRGSANTFQSLGENKHLQRATCTFLNDLRGLYVTPDQMLITRGAQMAIYIAANVLVNRGDHIVLTDPNYLIADEVFKQLGAVIHRIPIDDNGPDVNLLAQLLQTTDIKLLYLAPHYHHPTTVTMSLDRRIKLHELLNEFKFWLIEDDCDYDFQFKNYPVVPLASGQHQGRIIYIGSFTKLLSPQFRVSYLVGPKDFIKKAMSYRRIIDTDGDVLLEESLAAMISTGELIRHINKSNKLYRFRCELACRLIRESLGHAVQFKQPTGGFAIWLKFSADNPLSEIIPKAAAAGLFLTGSAYYLGEDKKHNGIRFGFASLSENELYKAVDILKQIIV